MANVRDSDTSLWLHNKLGTSNDSWISGSICSQLNKEVLRNIKECFPDLQTQVKLKLLLSFFHIPRRLVEEWKTELEEVIEVAGLDSELWVSMLAETMKTFPATSSLNTEISDYEDTRPIFTDMVNDLRKLVSKHSDLGMLPLECLYLNKNALTSVVGQQPNPVKHFTLKRKPKSANLRTELLHKSADAQSSLKKASAPTIPLRSRGMPRKMTDTTPLKGIPSRVPTSGFRSPIVVGANQQRPNLSRTPAGRKDGGIKLIEFTDQPLGYAAAKKRKREQQLEEQQKKQEQKQIAAAAAAAGNASPTTNSAVGGAANATGGTTPTTPTSANASFEIKTENSPTHNLSVSAAGGVGDDAQQVDSKEAARITIPKTEPMTPEYAPTLTYTQPPKSVSAALDVVSENVMAEPSKIIKNTSSIVTSSPTTVVVSKVTTSSASVQTQATNTIIKNITTMNNNNNNNNNLHHSHKRIKQEIEIKSEEILVPASIKLEKIEKQQTIQTQTFVVQQQQQQQLQPQQQPQPTTKLQQRIIIQQQQPKTMQQLQQQQLQTQHVLIRAAPQQQKQTLSSGVTLTSSANKQNINAAPPIGSTIKMEKLDIKPLTKATSLAGTGGNMTTSSAILSQQQLRQATANNPLANLPNNISVKITSTKAGKTAQTNIQQQQQLQQQQQKSQQQQPILINSSTPVILSTSLPMQNVRQQKQLIVSSSAALPTTTTTTQTIKSMPLSQLKSAANSGPVIISQTIIQPAKRATANAAAAAANVTANTVTQQQQKLQPIQQQQQKQQQTTTQYILTSAPQQQQQQQQQQSTVIPSLTSFTQTRPLYQTGNTQTPTKILLKTSASSGVVMTPLRQQQSQQQQQLGGNAPPPLIATATATTTQQQPTTMLNLQNVQLPNRQVTIQPASQAAQQQHIQAQLQQHHQPQHTIVSNTTATQQPKLTQVLMQPSNAAVGVPSNANVKNKTIILTQKGVLLRNIGGDMYQQIPLSNVSGLQSLAAGNVGGTTLVTTAAGPPNLVKTTSTSNTIQLQQQQQQQVTNKSQQQLPTLIPTQQHMIVQQQPQANIISNASTQQTIIRPVLSNVSGGLTQLPQGLTLIQRPGQQPQLVQVQAAPSAAQQQTTQLQRTIITQPQIRPQQIVLQHRPAQQRIITTTAAAGAAGTANQPQQIQITTQGNAGISRGTHIVQVQQPLQQQQQQQTQTQQQAPQRRGLSLSNEHVHKAHEMFRKANRVSRPDKALILGFMAGLRENPRPNSENVIVIKLGETEEEVQQEDGSTALCLVESLIRLDYNNGEWKTFQNYRRVDQSTQGQTSDNSAVMQTQNSVVI